MLPTEDVRAALDRLLASDRFRNAGRLSAFLRFAVEQTLAGNGARLKEYVLGIEVFGKGPEFDPRLDPVVRVEARRLRAKLQEYYEGPGSGDPVRIILHKGSYAPSFELVAARPPHLEAARRMNWKWGLAAVAALAGAAGLIALRSATRAPSLTIVVIPKVEQPEDQPFADGLSEALSAELARNPSLRVVAWPRVVEYRQVGPNANLGRAARELGAEAVLAVGIHRGAASRRISAVFMKPDHGFKQWAGEYERGLSDEFAVEREIARAIAEEVRGKVP